MAHHIRLYKQVERLLKQGKLVELAALVWQPEMLHEQDKRQKQTVGQLVANSTHFEALSRLWLEAGMDADADFGDTFAPMPWLRVCLFKRLSALACEVIARGARLDMVHEGGVMSVHDAVLEQLPDVICAMHEYGADLDAAGADDAEGHSTPLHMACQLGGIEVVSALLDCGVDIELANHRGETPLQIAVKQRHDELVKLLIARGAAVNVSKLTGRTPLHEAVNRRQPGLAALLISHGALIDEVDEDGWSALHLASARGDVVSVQLLCSLGANLDLGTTETCRLKGAEVLMGSSPLVVAQSCNQHRVVQTLEQREWDGVTLEGVLADWVNQG
jgi:hypothetical protein